MKPQDEAKKRQEQEELMKQRQKEEQQKEDERQQQPACENCGVSGHTADWCMRPPGPHRQK